MFPFAVTPALVEHDDGPSVVKTINQQLFGIVPDNLYLCTIETYMIVFHFASWNAESTVPMEGIR